MVRTWLRCSKEVEPFRIRIWNCKARSQERLKGAGAAGLVADMDRTESSCR